MERGVIKLFEYQNFTQTTAITDIFDYVQEAATKFCEIADMEIFESMSESEGKKAAVYVGRNGDSHPLFRICNNQNTNNYYNSFGITLTNDIGSQPSIYTQYGAENKEKHELFQPSTGFDIYLSYAKDGENVVFSLFQNSSAPSYTTNWHWIVAKAKYGNLSVPFAMHIFNDKVYASSDSRIGFTGENPAFIDVNNMFSTSSPILPNTKEAILDQDIYITGTDNVKIADIRLYSNKIGMQGGSIMKIGETKYFLIGRYQSTYPTLLLKLEEQT